MSTSLKWKLAGVGLSVAVYLLLLAFFNDTFPFALWYNNAGDGPDYIAYATNLANHGVFWNGGSYYSRMPMYPALLALFIKVLNPAAAAAAVVVLQVLLSGMATYLAGNITQHLCGNRKGFYYGFFLFACFPLLHAFDFYLLTESLALSAFVISVWLLLRITGNTGKTNLRHHVLLGFILLWLVGLRPYMILYVALSAAWVSYTVLKQQGAAAVAVALRNTSLLLLPLLLFEVWWIPRNYALSGGRVIVLQEGTYAGLESDAGGANAQRAYVAVWNWCNTVGEDVVFWNPGSFGAYFFNKGPFAVNTFNYSPRVLCSAYTQNDLLSAREQYARMEAATGMLRSATADTITTLFTQYAGAYKCERMMDYHITNRLQILKHALAHSGPVLPVKPFPEIRGYPLQLAVKLFSVLSYALVLVCGFGALLLTLLTFHRQPALAVFLALQGAVLFGFLCFYLRMTEFRIYFLVFPVLAFFTAKVLYLGVRYATTKLYGKKRAGG